MAKVICMASAKGGSGKTVITATFATFLAELEKKVLIIDTDASTNGMTLMYLKEVMLNNELVLSKKEKPLGTFEIKDRFNEISIIELSNNVHLLPASYSFQNTEITKIDDFSNALKFLIKEYKNAYDYIFFDAQAGSDSYASIAMKRGISDEVIIVSEYDPLSAAGIERLKGLFRDDLTYDRTWVLLNKMLPDFVQSFSDFLEVAKYLSPIPWDADVVRAYARRKLALNMEYGNEFTLGILQTLKSLLGDVIEDDLDNWLKLRVSTIKQPIKIQYEDISKQIQNAYKLRIRDKKRQLTFIMAITFVLMISIVAIGYFFKVKLLDNFFNKINDIVSVIVPTFIAVLLAIYYKSSLENTLKDSKYDNEIEDLKEKQKKLETLLKSTPDNLVKNRSSINL